MRTISRAAALLLLGTAAVYAAGTDYSTDINNVAKLNYKVAGEEQTEETSSTDTFKVDRKVDVTVATSDTANIIVVPGNNEGDHSKPLTYTVTNSTNGNQDYILDRSNLANDTATLDSDEKDNADFENDFKVCEAADCGGSNDPIQGKNIHFAEDEAKTFYIFADIPAGVAENGDRASIALTATAVDDGTTDPMTDDSADADDPAAVQVVFAEGAGDASGDAQYDGKHSVLSAYEVVTATITATKTSCIIWDPVNTTTKPKRIPGAVVRYAINVKNAGSADATDASLTDTLQSDLSYGTSAPAPAAVARIVDEACNCTDPGTDNGDTISATGQDVTAAYATIAASKDECAYFDVTIK